MENYSHFLLQKVSGRLLVVAYLCLAGSFKGSLGMWNWRSCASFCLSEESLHIPFLQLLTTWPLQELCNPSLPSLQESQPEILAPFMRQALFCVVYRCCRQFWDVKCCKPHFLVILQKYFTEVRFVHGDLLGLRSQTSQPDRVTPNLTTCNSRSLLWPRSPSRRAQHSPPPSSNPGSNSHLRPCFWRWASWDGFDRALGIFHLGNPRPLLPSCVRIET